MIYFKVGGREGGKEGRAGGGDESCCRTLVWTIDRRTVLLLVFQGTFVKGLSATGILSLTTCRTISSP